MTALCLHEWGRYEPSRDPRLRGVRLTEEQSALAGRLTEQRMLAITELSQGLRIETRSYVGSFQLGPLSVVIQPKLPGLPLMPLVRYAYQLRKVEILDPTLSGGESVFQDLLLHQLLQEVTELEARGLSRAYQPRQEWLESPRGRLDLSRYATAPVVSARLPCRFTNRSEDNPLNQSLLAGLVEASRLCVAPELKMQFVRLIHHLKSRITRVPFQESLLERPLDRNVRHYQPALNLIRLLLGGEGSQLESPEHQSSGFLFDMNRFFQCLLSRFMEEHTSQVQIQEEYELSGLVRFVDGYNPRHRQAPTPRPDFAVLSKESGRTVRFLDAKYRDLWENPLGRDMLYQLSLYALSIGTGGEAVILYPTLSMSAREARLQIHTPAPAQVILRPVQMHNLVRLIEQGTPRECAEYADYMTGVRKTA